MQPRFYFLTLFLITELYAFVDFRGRWRPEHVVAAMFAVAYAATHLLNTQSALRYRGLEQSTFIVDLMLLSGLVIVALRADRYWPLCMAAMQLMIICSHMAKAIHLHLLPGAYQESLIVWSYAMLVVLLVAVWRQRRRMKQPTSGRY